MPPRPSSVAAFFVLVSCVAGGMPRPAVAQLLAKDIVQSEAERTEIRFKEVRVEIGNRYEKKLAELRASYQKAADLEGALVVRGEEQRVSGNSEHPLEARNLVEEPRGLREVQLDLLAKQGEMLSQIVQEALPRLVEMKKSFTMAGKLDEAVEVRSVIQRFQEALSPAQRLSPGAQVTAEEVFQAYQSSKERADKMYKGVKLLLRGRVAGVRADPREPGTPTLVLSGGGEGALIDCAFGQGEYRVREERVGQNIFYTVVSTASEALVLKAQRGGVVEFHGKCEGSDGGLRFSGCSLQRR